MAEYLIQGETLTSIADKIRVLSGAEGAMTPAQMDGNLGEVNNEVNSQAELIEQIQTALIGKAAGGGSSGEDPFKTSETFTHTVDSIDGAQYGFAINDNGYYESLNKGVHSSYAICRVNLDIKENCNIVFNVINYAESNYDYAIFGNLDTALTLSKTADSVSNVKENFKGRQSASVVNVTYSNVTIGSHFIDIKFIKDGSGSKDYDSVQFKVQKGDEIFPQATLNKLFAADPDFSPENIRNGVNIFGVVGTLDSADDLLTGNFSTWSNDRITSLGQGAFAYMQNLCSIDFPNVTTIGSYAFYNCTKLSTASFPACTYIGHGAFNFCNLLTVSFPVCTSIGGNAFQYCGSLTTTIFPVCTSVSSGAFQYCSRLTTASFPACTDIGSKVFGSCYNLTSLYLTNSVVCTLSNSNAFSSTPIGGYSTSAGTFGSIYVPASLLTSYQTATNWTYFSSRFVAFDGSDNG